MELVKNSELKTLEKQFNKKRNPLVLSLPDFVENADGTYTILENDVEITSYAQFCEYLKKHEIAADYISENFPEVISTVYKNALGELSDYTHSTLAGKLLTGKPVFSTDIFDAGLAASSKDTIFGILRSANAKKKNVEGKIVELPKVKRTKKQIMKLFAKNKEGYFVPEINSNGLVTKPSKDKSHFNNKFIAVAEKDVTPEQVIEYLKAPFGDMADLTGIDFEKIAELCKTAYSSVGSSNMIESISNVIKYCQSVYPLSFEGVSQRKKAPVAPVKDELEDKTNGDSGVDEPDPSIVQPADENKDKSGDDVKTIEGYIVGKGKISSEPIIEDGELGIKMEGTFIIYTFGHSLSQVEKYVVVKKGEPVDKKTIEELKNEGYALKEKSTLDSTLEPSNE